MLLLVRKINHEESNMSRTYRRKSGEFDDWILKDTYLYLDEALIITGTSGIVRNSFFGNNCYDVIYSKNSKQGRHRLAKYHSDSYHTMWRGPMWWVREFYQKPYAQKCRNELNKFMRDPEHEVVLRSKPLKGYRD